MGYRAPNADAQRIAYRARHLLSDATLAQRRLCDHTTHSSVSTDLREITSAGEAMLVTLDHLKTKHRAAYVAWYAQFADDVDSDELLVYFRDLRNMILKKGWPAAGEIPDAAFVIMDPETRDVLRVDPYYPAPSPPPVPTSHRGEPLTKPRLETLCKLYINWLWDFYESAKALVDELQPESDTT